MFERLSADLTNMDTHKCVDQTWREQGNVSTSSFLFTADVLIGLALFGLWGADGCEALLGSEHQNDPSGSSSRSFSCSPLVVLT